jgi:hypothetical protein
MDVVAMNTPYHFVHHEILSLQEELLSVVSGWKSASPLDPCHIIVPHDTALRLWKRVLQERFDFYFNLEVWTPLHLFQFLQRKLQPLSPAPLKSDAWEFLMHLYWESHFPDMEPAALSKNIHSLTEAFFMLLRAGHSPSLLENSLPDFWRSAYRGWMKFFDGLAEHSQAYQERVLLKNSDGCVLENHHLVVVGFDSSHWVQFPLLTAALHLYDKGAVFTFLPSGVDREAQRYWLDWCDRVAIQRSFSDEDKMINSDCLISRSAPKTQFLFAMNMRSLAEKVCLWSRDRFADGHKRIVVILPDQSRLAQVVAHEFRLRDIPFFSEFPSLLPLRFDQQILEAWLRLQAEGLLIPAFLDFWKIVYTVPTWQALFSSSIPTAAMLEDRLQRLWSVVGESNLGLLRSEMVEDKDAALIQCVEAWNGRWCWPDRASLGEYGRLLLSQVDFLIGENIGRDIRNYLQREIATLSMLAPWPISKALAIDRFKKLLLRFPEAEQKPSWPFVHILTARSAQGLAWDAILCAEVHEGIWPSPARVNPWLSRELIASLNFQADGSERFILGHPNDTFVFDFEHFRQLFNLGCYRVDLGIAFYDETKNTTLTPSLFFTQAWQDVCGKRLDAGSLQEIKSALSTKSAKAREHIFLEAHTRRRDKSLPFDGYSFMLAKPARSRVYTVTQCEEILRSSDFAWYKIFLDCRPRHSDWSWSALRNLFQGSLIHRWLSVALLDGLESVGSNVFINYDLVLRSIYRMAEQDYHQMRDRYRSIKRPVPHHWASLFASFQNHTEELLRVLQQVLEPFTLHKIRAETRMSSEAKSLSGLPWESILIRGKIDLHIQASDENGDPVTLIFDYKTGENPKNVTPHQIITQKHFQLLGYAALAYEAQRAIRTLLLYRYSRPECVSVNPVDSEFKWVWKRLEEKLVQGRWGYALDFEERDLDQMPLAHVPISKEILRAKHALTFGLDGVDGD